MSASHPEFVVIGRWDDASSTKLTLQDFVIDGRSTIPIFFDEASFKRQTAGTPYEREGLVIDSGLLLSMLKDDDRLILDPGSARAVPMTKAQLASQVDDGDGTSTA